MDPEKREDILEMVRDQLQRTNPPSTEALYGRAVRIDEAVRELTLRQFHAHFPLRVHRERARETTNEEEGRSTAPEASKPGRPDVAPPDRAALRQLLHNVAKEVAGLSSGPKVIDWVEDRLEDYVDQAADALAPDGTEGR